MQWIDTTIGKYCPFIYGKGLPERKRENGDVPVYGSNGIVDYHNESHIKRFGIIIGRKGSVGAVHLSKIPFWPIDTSFYIEKETIEELYFAYYMLKSLGLEHMNSDSAVPGLNRDNAHALKIRVPESEDDRKALGAWIATFDKKIATNTQTNQTLEKIAQTLFKSWFVDFDPVNAKIAVLESGGGVDEAKLAAMGVIAAKNLDELAELKQCKPEDYEKLAQTAALFPSAMQDSELGEIPDGWEASLVKDVADTIKGKSYKSTELDSSSTTLVTLKSFNRGGGYRLDGLKEYTGKYKPEQEVFAGDLIVAYTDVTQAADVIGKPAMVISDSRYKHLVISLDVAVIRPSNDNLKYYLYGMAKTEAFQQHTQAHSTGTTVLHLSKNAVPGYSFILASDDLISVYVEHAQPIFSKINETIEENNSLAAFRDALLPKLLSGEIDLSNTNEATA